MSAQEEVREREREREREARGDLSPDKGASPSTDVNTDNTLRKRSVSVT